jgi:hypothetical protein
LAFVLIFIPAYSFFDVYVEPQRHTLGFEGDGHSPALIKATMRGENLHGVEKYICALLPQWKKPGWWTRLSCVFCVVAFVSLIGHFDAARFHPALNLEAARHRLIVIGSENARLDAALNLQTASGGLVVVMAYQTGFNVSFDFHTCPSPFRFRY